MKIIPFLFACAVVSGCTSLHTMGHLTDSTVQNYQSLTPTEFMQRKWFEENQQPVADGILNAVATASSFLSSDKSKPSSSETYWGRPVLFNDGKGVFWTAYYNDVNFGQLADPYVNFKKYCEARGGKFAQVAPLAKNFFHADSNAPFIAYLSTYWNQMEGLRSAVKMKPMPNSDFVIVSALSEAERHRIADEAGVGAYFRQRGLLEHWRTHSERAYFSKTYDMIEAGGGFGSFQCDEGSQDKLWGVAIVPFAVKSLTQNTAAMRLSINIVENK